jgi:hypothetical protein
VVQVGNGLGERERIFTALEVEWQQQQQQQARVRLVEERGTNLSHAFNVAASHARGTHLLFFLETMEVPARSGFTFPPPPPPGNAVDNVLDYLLSVIHQDHHGTTLPPAHAATIWPLFGPHPRQHTHETHDTHTHDT